MLRGAMHLVAPSPLLRSPPFANSAYSTARCPLVDIVTSSGVAPAAVTPPLATVTTELTGTVTASCVARAIVTAAGVRAGVRRMGRKAGKGKEEKGGPVSGESPGAPVPVTEGLGPVPPCLRVTSTGAVSIAVHAKPGSKQAAVSSECPPTSHIQFD